MQDFSFSNGQCGEPSLVQCPGIEGFDPPSPLQSDSGDLQHLLIACVGMFLLVDLDREHISKQRVKTIPTTCQDPSPNWQSCASYLWKKNLICNSHMINEMWGLALFCIICGRKTTWQLLSMLAKPMHSFFSRLGRKIWWFASKIKTSHSITL